VRAVFQIIWKVAKRFFFVFELAFREEMKVLDGGLSQFDP
jgi:hypothetical protein